MGAIYIQTANGFTAFRMKNQLDNWLWLWPRHWACNWWIPFLVHSRFTLWI